MRHKDREGFSRRFFTLMELVVVLLILGVMASTSLLFVQGKDDQIRYDATKDKLQQIKHAILGDPEYPNRPYFLKDMGRLPKTLRELVVAETLIEGSVPAEYAEIFSWDERRQHGWRGPYLAGSQDSDGSTKFRDGWMNDDGSDNFGWNFQLEEDLSPLVTDEDGDDDAINQWLVVQSIGSDETIGNDGNSGDYAFDYPIHDIESTPKIKNFLINRYEYNTYETAQFEETRNRLSAIKTAIIGNTTSGSTVIENCFYADMGRFPGTINELLELGTQTVWSDTVQSGWRGPYLDIRSDRDGKYRYRDGYNNPWNPSKIEIKPAPDPEVGAEDNQRLDDDDGKEGTDPDRAANWGWTVSKPELDDSWFNVQSIIEYPNTFYPRTPDHLISKSRDLPPAYKLTESKTLEIDLILPNDFPSTKVRVCLYSSKLGDESMPISEDKNYMSSPTDVTGPNPGVIVIALENERGKELFIEKHIYYIILLEDTESSTPTVDEQILHEYLPTKYLNYSRGRMLTSNEIYNLETPKRITIDLQ